MVNHGLSTGALFLCVGFLYERRHTRAIADFGGVARPMPVFAALFGIVAMSSIGLPGLNGFVGEFLILLGVFDANRWAAVVACIGVLLAACVMLWMLRRVMFGPVENPENRGLIDLGWRERALMAALIAPILWIGLYPNPVLRRIEPAVIATLELMDRRAGWSEVGPHDGLEGGEGRRVERWTSDRLVASPQRRGRSGSVSALQSGVGLVARRGAN
jgi:NADH-quinone oxidoreductase subunit M